MFVYEKRLQYPIKIKTPNPKLAAVIISQYGGPYINRLWYGLKNYAVGDGEGGGGFIKDTGLYNGACGAVLLF